MSEEEVLKSLESLKILGKRISEKREYALSLKDVMYDRMKRIEQDDNVHYLFFAIQNNKKILAYFEPKKEEREEFSLLINFADARSKNVDIEGVISPAEKTILKVTKMIFIADLVLPHTYEAKMNAIVVPNNK